MSGNTGNEGAGPASIKTAPTNEAPSMTRRNARWMRASVALVAAAATTMKDESPL